MSSLSNAVAGRMKRIPEMLNITAMENYDVKESSSIVDEQKESNTTVQTQESPSSFQDRESIESFSSGFFNFEQPDCNNHISLTSDIPPLAPILQRPIAPFDTTDRRRAYTSARYYGECFLHGISPRCADKAATEIQKIYQKWWVEASGPKQHSGNNQENHVEEEQQVVLSPKRHQQRRHELKRGISLCSSCTTSFSSDNSMDPPMKRQRSPSLQHVIDTLPLSAYWDLQDKCNPFSNTLNCTPKMLLPKHHLEALKADLIADLQTSGGCTDQPIFREKLKVLQNHYKSTNNDARLSEEEQDGLVSNNHCWEMDGTWLTLSKPTFSECKGRNGDGDYIYSLGRMSFDMFRPTNLTCSIQGIYNTVHTQTLGGNNAESQKEFMVIPKQLRKHIMKGGLNSKQEMNLKTYNIVVAFTIEPDQSASPHHQVSRPIRGIMTNFGYYVPDPDTSNRLSVWFTGGSLEVNDEEHDLEEWKTIFDPDELPKRDMSEYAKLLAAKILLGAQVPDQMEDDGTMSYVLKRPIGGHGSAYCDVLYMDDTLRIMQGHHGTIYCFSRVAPPKAKKSASKKNKNAAFRNTDSKKKMVGARMA